jgi:hypothetical protein
MITKILYFIHVHKRLEPPATVTVTSDTVYSTNPNQDLSRGQSFCTVNQEKPSEGAVSILNRRLLIWLQEHYIHYKFKPNYIFLESTLSPPPKKKKLKNGLKLGFTVQKIL